MLSVEILQVNIKKSKQNSLIDRELCLTERCFILLTKTCYKRVGDEP